MHYKKCFTLGFIFTVMFCNINAMEHKEENENLVTKRFSNEHLVEMFQWDPKVNVNCLGALFSGENIKSLEYLLSKGLDVNESESLPLFKAIDCGDPEVVQCVLGCKEIKIDIESKGKNCLIRAIELLEYRINRENIRVYKHNYKKFNFENATSIIKLILSHKDSNLLINKKSGYYQKTTLSAFVGCTIKNGLQEFRNILRDLLEHGENPYLKNGKGKSALELVHDYSKEGELKLGGLTDYMEHKYEEFKTNRKNNLIAFTTKLLSEGEPLDPERPCYLFPKDIANRIAIEYYKD